MHRHRPPIADRTPKPLPAELDKAHGFLWWCDQSALVFGSDRRQPTATRMTLSLIRGWQRSAVLPATTQANPAFYRLDPARFLTHGQERRESWLCPRYETVDNDWLLHKAGLVDQTTRVSIVHWLRELAGEPS